MKYFREQIDSIYEQNLKIAKSLLSNLEIAEGREPNIRGLNGWVFEQTIRHCLEDELKLINIKINISEQVALGGRAKVDLLIGNIAIEIKSAGSFGDDSKYFIYRKTAEANGWKYCYVSSTETVQSYREKIESIFDKKNTYYLDDPVAWKTLVNTIAISADSSSHSALGI